MPDTSNTNPSHEEPFEKFEQDKASSSEGKGMKPVSNQAMINFLHWVKDNYPGIKSLQKLSEQQLFQLVEEFEDSNVQWKQWQAGFSLLLEGHSNKEGYGSARAVLNQLRLW